LHTGLARGTLRCRLAGAPLNERLLAATRTSGTIAFLVFLSDACGYIFSVGLLLYQDISQALAADGNATAAATTPADEHANSEELHLFLTVLWACGTVVLLLLSAGTVYFYVRLPSTPPLLGDGEGDGQHPARKAVAWAGGETAPLPQPSPSPHLQDAVPSHHQPAASTATLTPDTAPSPPPSPTPPAADDTRPHVDDHRLQQTRQHNAQHGLHHELQYDLVIVGAGLIGSAAARHAVLGWRGGRPGRIALAGPAEAPRDEWGAHAAFGAHHDEGRITRATDPDPTWALLAQRSIGRYAEIAAQAGVPPFFTECGHLACGPAGSPNLTARADNAKALGVPYELLDATALRSRFPYLCLPDGAAGVFEPTSSGHISPRKLVDAQIRAARRMAATQGTAEGGAVTFDHVEEAVVAVEEAEEEAAVVAAKLADEAAVEKEEAAAVASRGFRVRLQSGRELHASRVLVACGAFTNGPAQLLPAARDTGDQPRAAAHVQLELQNTTTQVVQFVLNADDACRLATMPSVICKFPGHFWAYILPPITYPDGRVVLKLGGAREQPHDTALTGTGGQLHTGARPLATPEELLAWYRSGGDGEMAEQMTGLLHELVPGLQPASVTSDACANCRTPNGLPMLGMVRDGVHVATGGNGLAAKSSDEIGRLAACDTLGELMGGEQQPANAEASGLLAAERFAPRVKAEGGSK
jgi:glycine/D-amino acid oxidase-like deaminating enzyme